MVNCVAVIKLSTIKKLLPNPYCKNKTGAGKSTAIIEPMLGIKLSRNVNKPNKKAIFTLNKIKINHTISAVTKEVLTLTDKYLDTLANIA